MRHPGSSEPFRPPETRRFPHFDDAVVQLEDKLGVPPAHSTAVLLAGCAAIATLVLAALALAVRQSRRWGYVRYSRVASTHASTGDDSFWSPATNEYYNDASPRGGTCVAASAVAGGGPGAGCGAGALEQLQRAVTAADLVAGMEADVALGAAVARAAAGAGAWQPPEPDPSTEYRF